MWAAQLCLGVVLWCCQLVSTSPVRRLHWSNNDDVITGQMTSLVAPPTLYNAADLFINKIGECTFIWFSDT